MKMPGCALAALLLISCNSHAGGRSIPQLVNQARAEARKWQPDAQLVQIEVSDFGFALGPFGIPDITKARPGHDAVQFHISISTRGSKNNCAAKYRKLTSIQNRQSRRRNEIPGEEQK